MFKQGTGCAIVEPGTVFVLVEQSTGFVEQGTRFVEQSTGFVLVEQGTGYLMFDYKYSGSYENSF